MGHGVLVMRTWEGGGACNREMGETFPGTMSAEAMASPPMISSRHPQGGPDLPVHSYEANPRTKLYVEEGTPTPQRLLLLTFSLSHTCNTFRLFDVVGYCLIVHTSDVFSCFCCWYNLYSLLLIHTYKSDELRCS